MPSAAFFVSSLSSGGAERVVTELANFFSSEGWRIAVVTLAGTDADHYVLRPDVKRISLSEARRATGMVSAFGNNARRCIKLRRTIRQLAPDVAIAFGDASNVLLILALVGTGVPAIVSERTDPRRHSIGRLWVIARRWSYPWASSLVVQTESVAKWAKHFVADEKVKVIPNPVRELPPVSVAAARVKIILAVGRLDYPKGFDVLIRAFARSEALSMGYRLVIVGEGVQRGALENLVRSLDLERVIELPGRHEAPERWMEKATIFALPSRYEGFPNVLLEAMALGCPVIATDCDSGPREIIQDGVNGLLIPVDDEARLRGAIDRLLSDGELRQQLSKNARKVRELFAVQNVASKWKSLICDVIARDRGDA